MKYCSPSGRRNHETGTGQQVAQLHDGYMMMMVMNYNFMHVIYRNYNSKKSSVLDTQCVLSPYAPYNVMDVVMVSK